jgi:hypothetical protein
LVWPRTLKRSHTFCTKTMKKMALGNLRSRQYFTHNMGKGREVQICFKDFPGQSHWEEGPRVPCLLETTSRIISLDSFQPERHPGTTEGVVHTGSGSDRSWHCVYGAGFASMRKWRVTEASN